MLKNILLIVLIIIILFLIKKIEYFNNSNFEFKQNKCKKGSSVDLKYYNKVCASNNLFIPPKYVFLCDVNKHLQRKCFWKRVQ